MTAGVRSAESVVPCEDLARRVRRALDQGCVSHISDSDMAEFVALAVRLYAAKAEAAEYDPPAAIPEGDSVTPTEALVLVSALLRACDLNLFDVAMWFRR